ncbi:hypothetical protein L596_024697 [Steinernema carpocapsae]|uniref:Uncharacterized protein n=1 Tax=Steinernema carpocapsae TaxID=34508 RepID=A0A4U5M5I6_STECR|nr:hypothetical protein L596_024697 [Steinernema carpocapsae]
MRKILIAPEDEDTAKLAGSFPTRSHPHGVVPVEQRPISSLLIMDPPPYSPRADERQTQLYNSKHFCCCGCVDVKTGTIVIAIFYIIIMIMQMLGSLQQAFQGGNGLTMLGMLVSVITIICSGMAIDGVNNGQHRQLIGLISIIVS